MHHALVEAAQAVQALDALLGAPAHEGAARGLGLGRPLDQLAVAYVAEEAGRDLGEPVGRMLRQRTGILHRRHVDDIGEALVRKRAQERIAPECVEVGETAHGELLAHLQAVGHHAVERREHAVEAGEDAQVVAQVIEAGAVHDGCREMLERDALV